ncbi:DNA-directed DNA polymerase [Tanacetum coccineum]
MVVEFAIQQKFFSLTLEEFGRILGVPFEGQCSFSDKWSLDNLKFSVPTSGPYQTNPPTPNDIKLYVQVKREEPVTHIRHDQVIDVEENQILTRESTPVIKTWVNIIRENVFCLGGNWDHVPACLCHMLYCIATYGLNTDEAVKQYGEDSTRLWSMLEVGEFTNLSMARPPKIQIHIRSLSSLLEEGLKEGAYVENLTEYNVNTVGEVLKLLLLLQVCQYNETLHFPTTSLDRSTVVGAASRLRPYHFTYPERKLTMKEMLYKFIDEGKREHEEMRAFICLLTNKARLEEDCTITMNERCSAVLLNKLPSKEKDLGSFTIPYDISQLHINNALADIGDSISLMQYTMYEKLGLGEPKATRMSLELADRSIQYPRGITKNVLIKVDKFVLLNDFIILDMLEDSRVPIILGRPFLATARAMIDVFNKKITLRVGDDEVIFDVDQSIKRPPTEDDECYRIDDLDNTINAEAQELLANDEPDSFLSRGLEKSIDQSDLEGCKPVDCNTDNDSNEPIRCIVSINTSYLVVKEIVEPVKVAREHLYSASD